MLQVNQIFSFQESPFWQSRVAFSAVSAGFPSPADDYLEQTLNLQDLLVKNPIATYFVRIKGSSMIGAGIHDGDIVIVDRSLEPAHGKIAIVSIDSEFTVKRLAKRNGRLFVVPENENFAPLEITEETDFEVWGIVTSIIHRV